jgi:hypothetical protein
LTKKKETINLGDLGLNKDGLFMVCGKSVGHYFVEHLRGQDKSWKSEMRAESIIFYKNELAAFKRRLEYSKKD